MKQFTPAAVFILWLMLAYSTSMAQSPQKTANNKPASKPPIAAPKPKQPQPMVKSTWGKYGGSNNMLAAEEAKQLLSQPIVITDEKSVTYQLHSYQFGYRRRGVTENEQTGEVTPQSDMVIQLFKTTPLPELWQNNISETLHKDEELYFFDVIVYDKNGKLFFAPELKIIIK
jgi:hypothetical protein